MKKILLQKETKIPGRKSRHRRSTAVLHDFLQHKYAVSFDISSRKEECSWEHIAVTAAPRR
jgi:hypothetical protein